MTKTIEFIRQKCRDHAPLLFQLGLSRIADDDERVPVRIEVLLGDPEDVFLGDSLDPLGILGKVFESQTVKLNLGQYLGELGGGVEPQRETSDQKGLGLRKLLIGDGRFADVLDL